MSIYGRQFTLSHDLFDAFFVVLSHSCLRIKLPSNAEPPLGDVSMDVNTKLVSPFNGSFSLHFYVQLNSLVSEKSETNTFDII